ncbi:MAG TPA: HAD family hydrolase, partial [Candidatus Saccharimonadales bacterium]|nr:HAD family hydrolase [Candidatus Saccharimonadales bacterium]
MIKAVLFDAGGVLHVKNTAVGDDFQQEFGLSHEQVMEIFRHYVPLIGTGRMTEQQCLDDMAEKWHLRRATESERLFSRGFETTLEKTPGIYDLIDGLKKQGITVAVFSNVTPQFAEVQAQAGHYDPFDYRILSYEAGMWKPDPAFY